MRRYPLAIAVSLTLALGQTALAQQFGSGGQGMGGGGFNNSGMGNTGSSGMFGNRNLGSTIGGRNSGGSGIGQTDVSGTGAGILNGNERFMRNSRNANSFVGGDSGEARGFIGSVGSGQTGTFGGRGAGGFGGQGGRTGGQFGGLGGFGGGLGGLGGGLGGFGGRSGFNQFGGGRGFNQFNQNGRQFQNGQGNMQNTPRVRTRTTLGFSRPATNAPVVTQRATTLITRSMAKLGGADVNVQMDGQVAILRGTVPTDHARNLAEQLARLEPGIDQVQNELVVAGDTQ